MPSLTRAVRRNCLVILERLRAHAYHSHRRADFMRESGSQRADRGEPVRALQLALEFQFAPMPFIEIGARLIELLIELAEFFAEQFQFAARSAIGIVRRKISLPSPTDRPAAARRSDAPSAGMTVATMPISTSATTIDAMDCARLSRATFVQS